MPSLRSRAVTPAPPPSIATSLSPAVLSLSASMCVSIDSSVGACSPARQPSAMGLMVRSSASAIGTRCDRLSRRASMSANTATASGSLKTLMGGCGRLPSSDAPSPVRRWRTVTATRPSLSAAMAASAS